MRPSGFGEGHQPSSASICQTLSGESHRVDMGCGKGARSGRSGKRNRSKTCYPRHPFQNPSPPPTFRGRAITEVRTLAPGPVTISVNGKTIKVPPRGRRPPMGPSQALPDRPPPTCQDGEQAAQAVLGVGRGFEVDPNHPQLRGVIGPPPSSLRLFLSGGLFHFA